MSRSSVCVSSWTGNHDCNFDHYLRDFARIACRSQAIQPLPVNRHGVDTVTIVVPLQFPRLSGMPGQTDQDDGPRCLDRPDGYVSIVLAIR